MGALRERMAHRSHAQGEEIRRLRSQVATLDAAISRLRERIKDLEAQLLACANVCPRAPTPSVRVGGGYEYEGSPRWELIFGLPEARSKSRERGRCSEDQAQAEPLERHPRSAAAPPAGSRPERRKGAVPMRVMNGLELDPVDDEAARLQEEEE